MFTNFRAVVSSPDLWIVEDHLILIDFRNEAVEVVAELFQRRIKRHLVNGSGQLSATGTDGITQMNWWKKRETS